MKKICKPYIYYNGSMSKNIVTQVTSQQNTHILILKLITEINSLAKIYKWPID